VAFEIFDLNWFDLRFYFCIGSDMITPSCTTKLKEKKGTIFSKEKNETLLKCQNSYILEIEGQKCKKK
jgi:hypothetical protein